ncbi:MAG: sulfite exporter TauE/SafE family protein [bacterium]
MLSLSQLLLPLVALTASGLTLFSGFGLGTILMPAFAIFFPVEVAVAATGVVHLANNLFKLALLGRRADWGVVARFALPGALAAIAGAWLLTALAHFPAIGSYTLAGSTFQVSLVKLVLGALIAAFAVLELAPSLEARIRLDKRHLPLGGALSGFFGGLSGHQGALRSAVLLKCGLGKEAFITTGVVCAVVVDVTRLATYGVAFFLDHFQSIKEAGGLGIVALTTLAAFAGAFMGTRLMKKVTMRAVQIIVGGLLLLVALGLMGGLI